MEKTAACRPPSAIYDVLRAASRETPVDGPVSFRNVSDLLNAHLGAERWGWEYRVLRDSARNNCFARAHDVAVEVRLSARTGPEGPDVRRIGIGVGKDPSYGNALRKAVSDGFVRAAAQIGAWSGHGPAEAPPEPAARRAGIPPEPAEWQEDESLADHVGRAQIRHIHIMLRRLRWTGQEYREFLADRYGVRLGAQLSRAQREDLIYDLGKMFRAMEEKKIAS